MGMYDNLICEYPLPLPLNLMEAKDVDFNKLTYQTKNLDNALESYTIRKDGTLWVKRYEREYSEGDPIAKSIMDKIGKCKILKEWNERIYYTGTIQFYQGLQYDNINADNWNNDYWIDYQTTFVEGKINKIELLKFSVTDNTARKIRDKEFLDKMDKRGKLWNKWYMRYIYTYYDSFVGFVFKKYRKLMSKLPSSFKVEDIFRRL